MILLIAATEKETGLLRQKLPCAGALPGSFPLFSANDGANDRSLVITGVGKANAAAATALALARFAPQLAINFGCGGAFPGTGLAVGDLALAASECYGDDGVATPDGFLDMEDLGFPLAKDGQRSLYNQFPLTGPWHPLARAGLAASARARACRWREGVFVTVSSCSGSDAHSRMIFARSGALCETMEGAAVAHMCARFGVPLIAVRGISNLTGDRDPAAWDVATAAAAAEEAVCEILDRYRKENAR